MSGFYTVFKKELEDHFTSWRFIILLTLAFLVSVSAIFIAARNIMSAVSYSTDFIFLALFTTPISNVSIGAVQTSFLGFLAMLIPIIGIALGLDAINSERNNGTLSRLISQPIYRDNVINAKFLAGVTTISILLLTIILLVSGLGIRMIGVPPSSEEVWRLFFFLIIAIVYGAFWLGLAMLFSILIRRVATSALAAIFFWLFFAFFFPMIITFMINSMNPETLEEATKNAQTIITIRNISPIQLFNEATTVMLYPIGRSSSQMLQVLLGDAGNYMLLSPISLAQSLISVWPQLITTIMLTIVCFAISYIKFMREEIRA
jgi:ABC-2 type transport system permease protein